MYHGIASKTAFMAGLGVLFVPLLERYFGPQHKHIHSSPRYKNIHCSLKSSELSFDDSWQSTLRFWTPPLLAFVGVAILECSAGYEPPQWRDLLLFISPAAFGLNFWRAERLVRRHPNSTHLITGTSLCTITAVTAIWGLCSSALPTTSETWHTVFAAMRANWKLLAGISYLGLCVTAWASSMEQSSLKSLSATETTLIYTLEPLTGAAFAGLVLHEHMGWNTALGASIIITACVGSVYISEQSSP